MTKRKKIIKICLVFKKSALVKVLVISTRTCYEGINILMLQGWFFFKLCGTHQKASYEA
jgi:hypothetical protein